MLACLGRSWKRAAGPRPRFSRDPTLGSTAVDCRRPVRVTPSLHHRWHRWHRWHRLGETIGLLSFAFPLLFVAGCASEVPDPPNVVFVSLDTTRQDHLGIYGYERDTSPHLDALGGRGLVFDRAVAQMTITNPSHATMFTGLYPRTHKVGENSRKLADDFLSLPEVFKNHGFSTGGFVSGHPLRKQITGLSQGFDHYDSEMQRRRNGEDTVARAIEWLAQLRAAETENPFFLFVHFYDAHGPFRYRAQFNDDFVSPEPGKRAAFVQEYQEITDIDGNPIEFENHFVDRYDVGLRYQDEQLGKLLNVLDLNDTLVIVTADHGETLFERATQLNLNHGTSVFQEQIRIPLVFAGPGIEPGRNDRLAETTDLLPSVLDLLDWNDTFPYPLEGESLFSETGRSSRSPAFASNRARTKQHSDRGYQLNHESFIHSVQTTQWKLIRYPGLEQEYLELYDLVADPLEAENLVPVEDERLANVLPGLKQLLAGWSGDIEMGEGPELSPEDIEQLERLGYVN